LVSLNTTGLNNNNAIKFGNAIKRNHGVSPLELKGMLPLNTFRCRWAFISFVCTKETEPKKSAPGIIAIP